MKQEIKYVVFDGRESVAGSIIKDATSFAVVALMVYISRDSNWWTLVTGLMFIAFAAVRIGSMVGEGSKRFATKEELQKWVDSL